LNALVGVKGTASKDASLLRHTLAGYKRTLHIIVVCGFLAVDTNDYTTEALL